jgi:hypothetical protein
MHLKAISKFCQCFSHNDDSVGVINHILRFSCQRYRFNVMNFGSPSIYTHFISNISLSLSNNDLNLISSYPAAVQGTDDV